MHCQKILGFGKSALVRACQKYIGQEEGRKIRFMLQNQTPKGQPLYKNRNEALVKLI